MPDSCFCELIGREFPLQFANTYSSIFFLFFAGMILYRYFRLSATFEKKFKFFESPHRVYLYSFSLILTGIGSMYFHAGLSFFGQILDVTGMNFLAVFIFLYHYERIFGLRSFYKPYIYFNTILFLLLVLIPELRRYLFGIIIISSILLILQDQIKMRFLVNLFQKKKNLPQGFLLDSGGSEGSYFPSSKLNKKYFYISLSLIGLAFIFWILDISKIICIPNSIFQGHAFWHLLGSMSAYYLYLYYESETS